MNTKVKKITGSCYLHCKEIIEGHYLVSCETHGDHGVFTKKPYVAGTMPITVADMKFYFRADYWMFLAQNN